MNPWNKWRGASKLGYVKWEADGLAIHGCCGREPMIYIDGRNSDLKEALIVNLTAKGYPVQLGTWKYAGSYPTNICTHANSKKGVQLELSTGMRRLF